MDNLITIQVTDSQLAALQVLVAESITDVNGLDQALAVPIPAADCSHYWHPDVGGARCSKCDEFLPLETPRPSPDCRVYGCGNERLAGCPLLCISLEPWRAHRAC